MTKVTRRAAEAAAETTTEQNQVNTVMQVLKPSTQETPAQETKEPEEPEEAKQPESKPEKVNVYDVIRTVQEKFYLTEQHSNHLQQLNKLHDFRSRINVNTSLKLFNGGDGQDFVSNDPGAVETMIDICISNVKGKISEIENKLIAA